MTRRNPYAQQHEATDGELIAAEVARLRLQMMNMQAQVNELARLLALSKDERYAPRPPSYVAKVGEKIREAA